MFNYSEDAGYSRGNVDYFKCHDGVINGLINFKENFATSFNYVRVLSTKLYSWSNANQLYENGKKSDIYNVCEKIYYPYTIANICIFIKIYAEKIKVKYQ